MDLPRFIEHTNLSPTLTIKDIDQLVDEAKKYNFLGVCVPPFWVKRAKREIGNEKIILVKIAKSDIKCPGELLPDKSEFQYGALTIDLASNSVFKNGQPLDLTDDEYKLATFLLQNPGLLITSNRAKQAQGGKYRIDNEFKGLLDRVIKKVDNEGKIILKLKHGGLVVPIPAE